MSHLADKVLQDIEKYHLLSVGETVVVGVSGGPDSLCLLHLLCRLAGEYHLALHVGHLHHGLRGQDAAGDAAFVQALAADWSLPCTVEHADVPVIAREHRLAVEEAARRARYAFLSQVAERCGARTIAVGHHADDQAETVLMHWLRGSGLAGLRGMLSRTSLDNYRLLEGSQPVTQQPPSELWLIRPLLGITRAEIEDYCDYHGLEPRFDRSNLDTTYFRNWLRHEVLPLLACHNPNVREVICRSARVIADDYALLRSLLEETWPRVVIEEPTSVPTWHAGETRVGRIVLDLEAWRALPTSLQRSILREAIHRLCRSLRNINFLHVEHALLVARDGTTGDQATLPRGLLLTVGYDRLTVTDASVGQPLPDWPLLTPGGSSLSVEVPGTTRLPGSKWILEVQMLARVDLPLGWEANPEPWVAFLDAQAVEGPLWLRTRQAGDRFQPLGMEQHTVKLADFLTNLKVPRAVRDRLPLLVGPQGIAWVCGQRVDERARVLDETSQVLVLRFLA